MNTALHFLKPVGAIAATTYREIIRDRLLYGILIVAALLTASSFFMSSVSMGQDARILQNIGLSAIHFSAAFICIFTVTTSMARDVERRVLYLLFPKPISRTQYVLGKYFGFILLLLTTLLVLGGLFTAGTAVINSHLALGNLTVLGYRFLEIAVLIAAAELFASFTAALNAALYTAGLLVIGHSLTPIREYASQSPSSFLKPLGAAAYYLLPNLEKFDIQQAVLYGLAIPLSHLATALFYSFLCITLLLTLAVTATKQREL